MAARRNAAFLLIAAILATTIGCQTTTPTTNPDDPARVVKDDRGLLLRTGAVQLGPGTGKNLWGWQGDGKAGF
jgi:hypothetical protein